MTFKPKNNERGMALVGALLVIFVIAGAVGVALNYTIGVNKQTDLDRDYTELRFESEGALEAAYGVWLKTANNKYGAPAPADLDASIRGPVPPTAASPFKFPYAAGGQLKIDILDEYGAPLPANEPLRSVFIPMDKYPGWKGVKFSYGASVKLAKNSSAGAPTYGLKRNIEYTTVPLFQAMGFFEGNVELYMPAEMNVGGLVHTNSKALLSTANAGKLTFENNVSYVDKYSTKEKPIGANAWSPMDEDDMFPPTYPNGGASVQVNKVSRLEPLGTDPRKALDTTDDNPNNDSMRELIEPPVSASPDNPAIADRRLYNKAGIVVKITGSAATKSNISVTTKNGVSLTTAQVTTIKNAITAATITDRRENKTVDVSTVDIGAINSTLNTQATGFPLNGVLYVHDTSSSEASDPKAVRLKNGGTLPTSGLTVVSENPVYIQGDYNTGSTSTTLSQVPSNNGGNADNDKNPVVPNYTKVPSAVIGDAVTVLSNNWNDSNSSKNLSSRSASHTTVNTAIVTGSIPSGWDNDGDPETPNYGYSGGFNNFPRFLENWSGDSFTYFGSMVQLFTSQTFIGEWDTGTIYSPPVRAWNFDSTFLSKPPPGSLDVVSRERGNLVRY